jgi:hypothetical protein
MASEFLPRLALIASRGGGEGRVPVAPMVRVQQKSTRQNHRYEPDQPAFPAQWFYGLYVISPVTGLSCHRHFAIIVAKLSASVGAPGPHDFAVRKDIARPREDRASMLCVHRIPRPTFVTIAKRPSCECRTKERKPLIWVFRQSRRDAAHWHDGQISLRRHCDATGSARRAAR